MGSFRLLVFVVVVVWVPLVLSSEENEYLREKPQLSLYETVLRETLQRQEEERNTELVQPDDVVTAEKDSDKTGTITDFATTGLTSAVALFKINYNQDPGPLIKDIGDALVPLIALGLALIPVVGPIISGIFATLWSLFSPLLGGEEESVESKMEKMVEDAMNKMRGEVHEKLKQMLTSSISGELVRNRYVCDKYSLISANFSNEYKMTLVAPQVNETFQLEMIMFMENCDNFLKDTAEAFSQSEFADALWIPSAMTTLIRAAFLADLLSYGHTLRIPETFLKNYFFEGKHDQLRHFRLHAAGIKKRLETLLKPPQGQWVGMTQEESAACKMQSELLYLDKQLYPFGVPKNFTNKNNRFVLREVNEKGGDFEHIQVLAARVDGLQGNEILKSPNGRLFNCYMGRNLARLSNTRFEMTVVYDPIYSYTFRVIYFTITAQLVPVEGKNATVVVKGENVMKADFIRSNSDGNNVIIKIVDRKPEDEPRLFEVDSTYLTGNCNYNPTYELPSCRIIANPMAYQGKFTIDEVGTINIVGAQKGVQGKVTVTANRADKVFLVGVELIVRKKIVTRRQG